MDKEEQLKSLQALCSNTLVDTLDITFTDISETHLTGTMPVTPKVHQPLGMLHGGASIALAESLGSCLSNMVVDKDHAAVGTNINANHLKSKRDGIVTGTAKLIRKGKTLHFSEIEIRDEKGDLICHCTMTNMIINKR